jgi:solute carrier family 35 protein E1
MVAKLLALSLLVAAGSASVLPQARPAIVTRSKESAALKLRGGSTVTKAPSQPKALRGGGAKPLFMGVDTALLGYFAGWYLLNYYYSINNKLALTAAGGKAGFPMTISTMQLGVGVLYALFAWIAPEMRDTPAPTIEDLTKMIPVSFCAAAAHSFSVFAQSAGAVSFAMIVKAAEPAFAAVVGTLLYGKSVSPSKWAMLVPVIGGVIIASVKELDFAWSALITASLANLFAAFKANENKKLMDTPGIRDRLGGVGNQFAITTTLAFLISLPFMFWKEGAKFGEFIELFKTNSAVSSNLITSGLYFYLYNELATLTIKKTSATTQSVANTAKRVIVIVGSAIAFGESLEAMKMLGCAICIGGVFAYSLVK